MNPTINAAFRLTKNQNADAAKTPTMATEAIYAAAKMSAGTQLRQAFKDEYYDPTGENWGKAGYYTILQGQELIGETRYREFLETVDNNQHYFCNHCRKWWMSYGSLIKVPMDSVGKPELVIQTENNSVNILEGARGEFNIQITLAGKQGDPKPLQLSPVNFIYSDPESKGGFTHFTGSASSSDEERELIGIVFAKYGIKSATIKCLKPHEVKESQADVTRQWTGSFRNPRNCTYMEVKFCSAVGLATLLAKMFSQGKISDGDQRSDFTQMEKSIQGMLDDVKLRFSSIMEAVDLFNSGALDRKSKVETIKLWRSWLDFSTPQRIAYWQHPYWRVRLDARPIEWDLVKWIDRRDSTNTIVERWNHAVDGLNYQRKQTYNDNHIDNLLKALGDNGRVLARKLYTMDELAATHRVVKIGQPAAQCAELAALAALKTPETPLFLPEPLVVSVNDFSGKIDAFKELTIYRYVGDICWWVGYRDADVTPITHSGHITPMRSTNSAVDLSDTVVEGVLFDESGAQGYLLFRSKCFRSLNGCFVGEDINADWRQHRAALEEYARNNPMIVSDDTIFGIPITAARLNGVWLRNGSLVEATIVVQPPTTDTL